MCDQVENPSPLSLLPVSDKEAAIEVIDNPCWGSPTRCSLADLLRLIRKETSILYEDDHVVVLDKPPDLRMDGPYPATVHKLLTYWYPAPSIQQRAAVALAAARSTRSPNNDSTSEPNDILSNQQRELLRVITTHYHVHSDCQDCPLRPCHQLDYATSGILLVARHKSAAAKAHRIWEERSAGLIKVYTAVLLGHVHIPNFKKTTVSQSCKPNPLTVSPSHWPVVTVAELKSTLTRMEKSYRKSRHTLHKSKSQSMPGYVPACSLFQKWSHQQDKLLNQPPKNQSSPDIPLDPPRPSAKKVKPNTSAKNQTGTPTHWKEAFIEQNGKGGTKGLGVLNDEEWGTVWEPMQKLSAAEYAMARTTTWKQLKKVKERQRQKPTSSAKVAEPCEITTYQEAEGRNATACQPEEILSKFEHAAVIYNQMLQAKLYQSAPPQHDMCGNNVSGALFALPSLFLVQQDASVDNDSHGDSQGSETFYICTPLAQVENEFAMRIHPMSRGMQCPIPQAATELPVTMKAQDCQQYYNIPVGSADFDNFKPSLTKCTILRRTYLKPISSQAPSNAVIPVAIDGTGVHEDRVPVTLVQMQPLTGRRHQLRVHAALAGHAIAGDCTYASNITKSTNEYITQQATAAVTPNLEFGMTAASTGYLSMSHSLATSSVPLVQQSPCRSLARRLCLHATALAVPGLLVTGDLSVQSDPPFKIENDVIIIRDIKE